MEVQEAATRIAHKAPTLFRRFFLLPGSFDPCAKHHRKIVEALRALAVSAETEDKIPTRVVVWPIGPYDDKQQVASVEDRLNMLTQALEGLPIELITDDLKHEGFGYTSNYQMQARFAFEPSSELQHEYLSPQHRPGVLGEVWHVIGADNVNNIKRWNEGRDLWTQARWIVIDRPGYAPKELPPKSIVLSVSAEGSCTDLRARIANNQPWEHLVSESVALYIKERGLYGYTP